MTKLSLKSLAATAVLLLSAQIASAGPDGTCEEYGNEETAASEAAPSAPVPTVAVDHTKIAQIAPAAQNNATVIASAKTDAVEMAAPAKKSDPQKQQTESLPK